MNAKKIHVQYMLKCFGNPAAGFKILIPATSLRNYFLLKIFVGIVHSFKHILKEKADVLKSLHLLNKKKHIF